MSLPTNPASKPPTCLTGPVGSGKTREAKGIAEFFGLPIVISKVEDYGEDSFWVNLDRGGLLTLDNADTRNKWITDAVASAATDGSSPRRKLYTNQENITLRARAWLIITSANPTFAADAGLADRLLPVRMDRRTDETSDAELSEEIALHRDSGLSFVAQILSKALADRRPTPKGLNHRHPDFARFAVKIGRAMGIEQQAIDALRIAEDDKSLFCLQNDTIGAALLSYLSESGDFNGTAAELREPLTEHDDDLKQRGLSTKRIGKRLYALWPHQKPKNADYADYQTPFSEKSPYTHTRETFAKTAFHTRQTRQDLIDEAKQIFNATEPPGMMPSSSEPKSTIET
jgi:hypothetical protein